MNLSVCTLFEKDYHSGVAALVNSLIQSGFEGNVYVGYRGRLPFWASGRTARSGVELSGAEVMDLSDGVTLYFIPIHAEAHLTNYKPRFMLELFSTVAAGDAGMFYFDPDIVINDRWTFFEDWLRSGIALCEDVNSPIHENDPIRAGWKRSFPMAVKMRTDKYVNGGCFGVMKEQLGFVELWQSCLGLACDIIGGSDRVGIGEAAKLHTHKGFGNCFEKTDQDCLNAAIERSEGFDFSILSRKAMGFESGDSKVPHAVGSWKPWHGNYLLKALKGNPPRTVDKVFWSKTKGPIQFVSPARCSFVLASLKLAALMGRFYRRR